MKNESDRLQFYKISFYSSVAFIIIMASAFAYTIYQFQIGIEESVEQDLSILKAEITKAIDTSSNQELVGAISVLTQQFDNSVVAFATDNCPTGWQEYKPAYGRFIRGVDKGVIKQDPDGEREIGGVQQDEFKSHNHQISVSRADTDTVARGLLPYFEKRNYPEAKTSFEGGKETRPKNVALLYCIKK